jgi:intracellular sulfur oxidation DsrE/DsrF family protein
MSGSNRVSDELLNAFVDDELDKAERERIFELIRHDPLLAQRLCELTHMKELVRAARPEMVESTLQLHQRVHSGHGWGIAAMLFMILSFSSLLFLSEQSPVYRGADEALHDVIEQHADMAEIKVVMQITRSNAAAVDKLLGQAETLVNMGTQLDKPVRVEIVAYGQGLSMLRADLSPYAQRIRQLHRQYDNLVFVACQETLDKQQHKGAQTVRVLPGVVIVHSGVDEVKLRRSQGWSVLKA